MGELVTGLDVGGAHLKAAQVAPSGRVGRPCRSRAPCGRDWTGSSWRWRRPPGSSRRWAGSP